MLKTLTPTQNVALIVNAFAKAEICDVRLFRHMAEIALQYGYPRTRNRNPER